MTTLARLILSYGAFEADRGKVRASGVLMDMTLLFQEFVTVALQETLDRIGDLAQRIRRLRRSATRRVSVPNASPAKAGDSGIEDITSTSWQAASNLARNSAPPSTWIERSG